MIMDESRRLQQLCHPTQPIDVVLDTDTYNEIDDQFAVAYLLKSGHKLRTRALYAAPFANEKAETAEEGMEKSYHELLSICRVMGRDDMLPLIFRGSRTYLPSEAAPVPSPAAEHLAQLAMEYTPENPLYVAALGAITNVASAILLNPAIVDRIVIVWLGGNAWDWHNNYEFNLRQDVAAARVVFGCGAALVQLPCMGVVSGFTVSNVEMRHWLLGKNELATYLAGAALREMGADEESFCRSRVIWDVTVIAWLLNEGTVLDCLEHSPIPEYDHHYAFDRTRHLMRCAYHIDRDALLQKLVDTLTK